jgi:tetratricopeptide (TPR) repeat protein
MALAWSLFVARGAGAAEREPILNRARELCERLGDSAKLMEILLALAFFCLWRGEDDRGRELGQKVVAMAEQSQAPAMLARAHSQLGVLLVTSAQLEEGREHLERALNVFESGPSRTQVQLYEMANAQAFLSVALLYLGYPAAAIRKERELKDAALCVSDPVLMARSLLNDALLYIELRDDRAAARAAEELLSIATEHGLVFRLAQANFFQGWGKTIAGQAQQGIAEMRRAMSDLKAFGWRSTRPLSCAVAEACLRNKLPEEGLAAVAEGLAVTSGHVDPALQQLKGELLLIQDPADEAEAEQCFRTAIEIARHQKAKFWELRATTSLTRLLKSQGKTQDAREMLAEIYNWFTEGFELPDLKDAKTLLDELSG